MNKANKITMIRVIMSVIIIILMLFPFDQMGIDFPTFLIGGRILVDLKISSYRSFIYNSIFY
ncbi:MAG: hypothetical protein L6V91_09745 [Bacilli bacterium]|nr:MAG: hypothetical protein L6V91_09745 [Bacilli bacterium]